MHILREQIVGQPGIRTSIGVYNSHVYARLEYGLWMIYCGNKMYAHSPTFLKASSDAKWATKPPSCLQSDEEIISVSKALHSLHWLYPTAPWGHHVRHLMPPNISVLTFRLIGRSRRYSFEPGRSLAGFASYVWTYMHTYFTIYAWLILPQENTELFMHTQDHFCHFVRIGST